MTTVHFEATAASPSEHAAHLVAALEDRSRELSAVLNAITDGVLITDAHGKITHVNAAAARVSGVGADDPSFERWSEIDGIFHADGVTPFPTADLPLSRALGGEVIHDVELFIRVPGRPEGFWCLASASPIRDEAGALRGAITLFRDVSERKLWEQQMERQLALEKERVETLERMQSAIRDLSTPILEIWDDVLVLPIIGIVDSRRAAEMMERLLREVEHKQCRFVIVDITGVDVIDTATADHFVKIVNAVEILGARCILTGARGAVAQTLVSLGLNLGPLVTLRNLKHALRECLRTMEDGGRSSQLRELLSSRGGRRG